ncbi:MAG: RpiB/LacA/LacB family sugar-phosphate isomerase [Candidatus Magasanikbacteria bacterium]
METKKLYIASDHGGHKLKKRLVRYIENHLKLNISDLGPKEYNETDDYPDYAIPLAEKVAKENAKGILICKNGIGVCMAANKVKGIRAGIGYSTMAAETMVKDDNTNILCLAAKGLSEDHAMTVTKTWLETEFGGEERHVRRLEKLASLEE